MKFDHSLHLESVYVLLVKLIYTGSFSTSLFFHRCAFFQLHVWVVLISKVSAACFRLGFEKVICKESCNIINNSCEKTKEMNV